MKEDFLLTRGVLYLDHRFLLTRPNREKEFEFKRRLILSRLKNREGANHRSFKARRSLKIAVMKVHRHPKYVKERANFRFHKSRSVYKGI